MESTPEIIINIQPDGTVSHIVNGAVGTECDALTKPLEDALGLVEARQDKPEYYEGDGQQEVQVQVGL